MKKDEKMNQNERCVLCENPNHIFPDQMSQERVQKIRAEHQHHNSFRPAQKKYETVVTGFREESFEQSLPQPHPIENWEERMRQIAYIRPFDGDDAAWLAEEAVRITKAEIAAARAQAIADYVNDGEAKEALEEGRRSAIREFSEKAVKEIKELAVDAQPVNPEGAPCNPRCHDSGREEVMVKALEILRRLANEEEQ